MKFHKLATLLLAAVTASACDKTVPSIFNDLPASTSFSSPGGSVPSASQLSGGFIEYFNSMRECDGQPAQKPIDWDGILSRMQKAGMNTVIIKRLALLQNNTGPDRDKISFVTYWFYPEISSNCKWSGDDPTEKILKYADKNQMKIYLGLWEDGTKRKVANTVYEGFTYSDLNSKYLLGPCTTGESGGRCGIIAYHKKIADDIFRLYGKHTSFAGWYIPQEIWNIPAAPQSKLQFLTQFLQEITAYCRQTMAGAEKKVLISPYFKIPATGDTHIARSPTETTETYTNVLKKVGIDVLVLQDSRSANERNIDNETAIYFEAFAEAVKKVPKMEFWANIENFAGGQPTKVETIKKQICLIKGSAPSKLVTFDFYHYMNPVIPDCDSKGRKPLANADSARACTFCLDFFRNPLIQTCLKARETLYNDYCREFVEKSFTPSEAICEAITGTAQQGATNKSKRKKY